MPPLVGDRRAAAATCAANLDEAAVHGFLCVAAAAEGVRRRMQLSLRCTSTPMSASFVAPPLAASVLTAAASSVVLPLAAVIGASSAKISAAGRAAGAFVSRFERLPPESLLNKFRCYTARAVAPNGQEISDGSSCFRPFVRKNSLTRKKSTDVPASAATSRTLLTPCHLPKYAEPKEAGTGCETGRPNPAVAGSAAAAATLASAPPVAATLPKPTAAIMGSPPSLRFPLLDWLICEKSSSQHPPQAASRTSASGSRLPAASTASSQDVVGTRVATAGYFSAASAAGRGAASPDTTGASSVAGTPAFLSGPSKCRRRAAGAASGSRAASGSGATLSSAAAVSSIAAASALNPARAFASPVPFASAAALGTAAAAATVGSVATAVLVGGSSGMGLTWVSAVERSGRGGGRGSLCGDTLLRRRGFVSAGAAPPRSTGAAAQRQMLQQQETGLLHAVSIPPLGDSVTRGSVLEWRKKVGEPVHFDEVLCVIETDKVTVEIHSDCEGVVVAHAAAEGESLNVGSELALIRVTDPEAANTSFPAHQPPQEVHLGPQLQQHRPLLEQEHQQQAEQQHLQQQQQTEEHQRSRGDLQTLAAEEGQQKRLSERPPIEPGAQRAGSAQEGRAAPVQAARGNDNQEAPAAAEDSAEAKTATREVEERKKLKKTRSPSIVFVFARRKAVPAGGEAAHSTRTAAAEGRVSAQQQTGGPSRASADAALDEDPLMELWGVPRWRSLSEEEIEAVNLGGAGAGANALGSWKTAVVQVQEKQPQQKQQEIKQKQQDPRQKQQKTSSKQQPASSAAT